MKLNDILEGFRAASKSEREKGDYFETLVRLFLKNDPVQKGIYSDIWMFKDWAKKQGWKGNDTGIDLVAQLSDGSGFAAIQCKFYAPNHVIQKPDIDSFISAASNDVFTQLIIVDTTQKDFGKNTQNTLNKLSKDWHRIGVADLETSPIDWDQFFRTGNIILAPKKVLRNDQKDALEAVKQGLQKADRGKMIMACGTGKTFTSLKIAETLAGKGKRVLFMVPSLALMAQTVTEWKNDCQDDFTAFSACSDVQIGKRTDPDTLDLNIHDLSFPATTDAAKLAGQVNSAPTDKMTVIFSTYHSIDVLTRAQKDHGLPEFDLVICDEAHRTTGVTLKDDNDSTFVRIHDNAYVKAKKRLYMTATPRVFGEGAKRKADDYDAELASMDDESKFGKDLFHRGFGWAVQNNLLTDYKVIVLAVDEGLISDTIQNRLKEGAELKLDDATKIIGCYKALTKENIADDLASDPQAMKRALIFCQTIATSKMIESEFDAVVQEYTDSDLIDTPRNLSTQVRHIDGNDNAGRRKEMLDWLKADTPQDECRLLTNARVLSEGVDVPALDAIMFMHPRKSQIDVVQSVGRVMRRAEGKNMGYVILPIAVPPNTAPEQALNDNERYRVVWQILNALRAHDERLDARINQAKLGEDISDKIDFIRISSETELKELTAVVEDINVNKTKAEKTGIGIGDEVTEHTPPPPEVQGEFALDEFTRAIMAKIVEKCGTREYWDAWAKDIAQIAQTHITRITSITKNDGPERSALLAFLQELHDDLNPSITKDEAIEMLAQHLITKPVFDALFKDNQFTKENPVSKAMETVLEQLNQHNLQKESESLQKFYASVQNRAAGIKTAAGRQALITELYDKFFKSAFPKLTEKMGIVYTPIEVVDFIIHSVNDVLKSHFGQTLGSKDVHILDPFTGTGTFITRLLQSGLIAPDELAHKYKHEIHANEIILLAYYIAAINIETVYHELQAHEGQDETPYDPFSGILLTDTFQMHEQTRDMIANLLPDNSQRRTRQKALDIRVIIGNPPYSAGQKSANDDAANLVYSRLDAMIRNSYAKHSSQQSIKNLYDSYIRAFRWASDRLGDAGVMAYVSNAGFIDGNAADGMRKCLAEEYSDLYVFHLRGNARTAGELRRKEKGNVFGEGTRTPVIISVFVKNPKATEHGRIYFHDIGDYLDQKQKLGIIRHFKSIDGITAQDGWTRITPDENNDWLDQVDKSFEQHIQMGNKDKGNKDAVVFENYSLGANTNRDAWAYNSFKMRLAQNMASMIKVYNGLIDNQITFENALFDPTKIKWSSSLETSFKRGVRGSFQETWIQTAIYRPFEKTNIYFDPLFIHRRGQMPRIFPNAEAQNLVISVAGIGSQRGFSALMTDTMPDIQLVQNGQCFPFYLYENAPASDDLLSGQAQAGITRRDAITDAALAHILRLPMGM